MCFWEVGGIDGTGCIFALDEVPDILGKILIIFILECFEIDSHKVSFKLLGLGYENYAWIPFTFLYLVASNNCCVFENVFESLVIYYVAYFLKK